jgi:hypothetical protein
MAPPTTRERLLVTAERLFAERGVAGHGGSRCSTSSIAPGAVAT